MLNEHLWRIDQISEMCDWLVGRDCIGKNDLASFNLYYYHYTQGLFEVLPAGPCSELDFFSIHSI